MAWTNIDGGSHVYYTGLKLLYQQYIHNVITKRRLVLAYVFYLRGLVLAGKRQTTVISVCPSLPLVRPCATFSCRLL